MTLTLGHGKQGGYIQPPQAPTESKAQYSRVKGYSLLKAMPYILCNANKLLQA